MTGVIIGLARAIGETAPLITIGALDLHRLPADPAAQRRAAVLSLRVAVRRVHRAADPDVQLGLAARASSFQANAAAAGLVLLVMTLLMNAGAIYFRYRLRKRITW